MKRVLTGIAAAGVVLGMTVPTAFAATNSSMNAMTWKQDQIMLGTSSIGFKGFESMYAGTETTYMPIYYLNEYLHKMGFGASWDGVNKVWSITTPTGVTVDTSAFGTAGQGTAGIYVNGTLVQMTTPKFAKDPASHVETTYMPIYFLLKVLQGIGVATQSDWNGNTGTLSLVQPTVTTTTPTTTSASLSAITATSQTNGTGTEGNPAVALNSGTITLSTTLTDAMGNPVPNTAVTFNVSEYGTLPAGMPLPTVTSNGSVVSATAGTDAEQYTVYTNSNGIASVTMAGPSGQTYAYEVTASAPYQTSNGMTVMSSPFYTEFVGNNEAGISPLATSSSSGFGATLGTAVPVTVAIPPNASGDAQANALVTMTLSSGSSAYFTNSAGADLGQTIDVTTNSAGVATAMVNDNTAETVGVTASLPSSLGVTNPPETYLSFAQAGVPQNINNYSISATSAQAGTNITVSGTVVDAAGNPVPNGQLLLTGWDSDGSGDFGYVTTSNGKSTTTDFNNVGTLQAGQPVSSSLGDVITADANGNFSFVVTDADPYVATFDLYGVNDGEVTSMLKSGSITFTQGTTLSSIALGYSDSQADNNTYTSLTGATGTDGAQVPVYVDPQNASGDQITGQSFNYSLSVNQGGDIMGIEGVNTSGNTSFLPINGTNGLGAVSVDVQYNSTSNDYTITVPGQTGSLTSTTPDFAAYVSNSAANTTLTVTSGSASSTAAIDFAGGVPTLATSLTPAYATLVNGQSTQVTYEVENASGDPVPNTEVALTSSSASNPLWITAVNGDSLTQSEPLSSTVGTTYGSPTYETEATPIPLGTANYGSTVPSYVGSSSTDGVNISGVIGWSGSTSAPVYVYTNSNGDVTLTLQNGGVSYFNGTSDSTSTGASTGSVGFYTYSSDTAATAHDLSSMGQLVIGNASGDASTQIGTISFGSSTAPVTSSGTITFSGQGTADTAGTYTATLPSGAISGGVFSISNNTSSSGVTINSSTGEITDSSTAAAGDYDVVYSLNGYTEDSGTFDVTSSQTASEVLAGDVTQGPGTALLLSEAPVSGETAWLAPAGTTSFASGDTMSSTTNQAIVVPSTAGTYYLYLVSNTTGTVLSTSSATVTVS